MMVKKLKKYCNYFGKVLVKANSRVNFGYWIKTKASVHSSGYQSWFGNYGLHWLVSGKEINGQTDMFYALGAHGQYYLIPYYLF